MRSALFMVCLLLAGLSVFSGCTENDHQLKNSNVETGNIEENEKSTNSSKQMANEDEHASAVKEEDELTKMSLDELLLTIREGGHKKVRSLFQFTAKDLYQPPIGSPPEEKLWNDEVCFSFVWETSPFPVEFSYSNESNEYFIRFPLDYLASKMGKSKLELITEFNGLTCKYGCTSSDENGAMARALHLEGIKVWLQMRSVDNDEYTDETYPSNMYIGSPLNDDSGK